MTRYAIIQHKGGRPQVVRPERGEPIWREESFQGGMELFTRKWTIDRIPAHIDLGGWVHDARFIPDADMAEIDAIDAQIRALREARQALLDDRFRTWPLANATTLDHLPGHGSRTLAEAKAQHPGAKVRRR